MTPADHPSLVTTQAFASSARWLIVALAFAVLGGLALAVDLPIARLVKAHNLPGDLSKVLRLSEAFAHGIGVTLIIVAAAVLDPRGLRIIPRLALGGLGAGILADVFKLGLGRTRPDFFDLTKPIAESFLGFFPWRNANVTWDYASMSFPSAHTATGVGLAIALSRLYPRGRWYFAILALFAGLQRIDAGAHYVSDVCWGAGVGFLSAAILELPRIRRRLERWEIFQSRDREGC